MGFPILGDPVYGAGGAVPLQLHAQVIEVPLYSNKDPIRVEAPIPEAMRAGLAAHGLAPPG